MFSKKPSIPSKQAQEAAARKQELKEQLVKKKQADLERKGRLEKRQTQQEIPSTSKDKGKAKEIIETSPSEQLLSESLPQKLPESLPKESPERSSSSSSSSKPELDSGSYDSTESNPDPS